VTSTTKRTSKVGRPRAVSDTAPDTSARDQILSAAAALFVAQGIGSTSTRAIAEAVGIRQASLYYHFAGKDEILAELLTTSVRPSLDFSRRLLAETDDAESAAAALYALALVDVATLTNAPHNIGTLYLLPEVQDPRYDTFRAERAELQSAYGALGTLAASDEAALQLDEKLLGAMLIQLVEVVIQLRRENDSVRIDADALAGSCLRLLGLSGDETRRAVQAARQLTS
jgi:AcrR family transcriptional regulator